MKRFVAALVLMSLLGPVKAADDPACRGKDSNVCDTLGTMINLKGKGCYRMMKVNPNGSDSYRITCELASYDKSLVTYTLTFSDDRKSYVVY